jgi:hypothetical protein
MHVQFCQKLVKRFPEGFIGHAYDKVRGAIRPQAAHPSR